MPDAFGRYVHAIMERGADEAHQAGSTTIEAEHLLLAMAAVPEQTTQRVLATAGLDHQAILDALDQEFRHSLSAAGVIVTGGDLPRPSPAARPATRLGASARLVFERGTLAAAGRGRPRPVHLLLGVLALQFGTVPRALALAGVDRAALTARATADATATPDSDEAR